MTCPSSFRPSSMAYNLTLPYKYRRKSLTADDADITNRVPGLSSGGSSCSSSPIASSAILSSRNADSPTEYAPSEDEIWSDARYMGYASRVPFQHKRYDRRYAQAMPYLSRQTTPCVHHQYDTSILSDDDHDLHLADSDEDDEDGSSLFYSTPRRRISFCTSAERDQPYVRPPPKPAATSRKSFLQPDNDSFPSSSPTSRLSTSPMLPPSSPPIPPSSPFTMSLASSPGRSLSPTLSIKRSVSPEKLRDVQTELTISPPVTRRGRVSIESLLSPEPPQPSRSGNAARGMTVERSFETRLLSVSSPSPSPFSRSTSCATINRHVTPALSLQSSTKTARRSATPPSVLHPHVVHKRSATPHQEGVLIRPATPVSTAKPAGIRTSGCPLSPSPTLITDLASKRVSTSGSVSVLTSVSGLEPTSIAVSVTSTSSPVPAVSVPLVATLEDDDERLASHDSSGRTMQLPASIPIAIPNVSSQSHSETEQMDESALPEAVVETEGTVPSAQIGCDPSEDAPISTCPIEDYTSPAVHISASSPSLDRDASVDRAEANVADVERVGGDLDMVDDSEPIASFTEPTSTTPTGVPDLEISSTPTTATLLTSADPVPSDVISPTQASNDGVAENVIVNVDETKNVVVEARAIEVDVGVVRLKSISRCSSKEREVIVRDVEMDEVSQINDALISSTYDDMDIVVDDEPALTSAPECKESTSRYTSPVAFSLTRHLTDEQPTASTSTLPTFPSAIPRTPVKASRASSSFSRASSPAALSSPLSPLLSSLEDEVGEDDVPPKKRKGKKAGNEEKRQTKRVRTSAPEKKIRRKKSLTVDMTTSEDERRAVEMKPKMTRKSTIVLSDDEDGLVQVAGVSDPDVDSRKPVKKRGRKKKEVQLDGKNPLPEPSTTSHSHSASHRMSVACHSPYSPFLSKSPSKLDLAPGLTILDLLPFKAPLPLDELQGMLIETLATSRASSLPPSVVYSSLMDARPALRDVTLVRQDPPVSEPESLSRGMLKQKTNDDGEAEGEDAVENLKREEKVEEKMGRKEWMVLIEGMFEEGRARCGMFGKVESSFKDDHERPLEAQWFYVPECDTDTDRATLIRSMMPRPGKRTVTKQYKQYYWRPLGKISRWDDEDAM
ncbi:unnamed protein product [Somion occarium]|uniref:Uncharacterized protein n=1 Tax=Somion occarium TaxID=3059160 RepID=A0ABP1DDG1_9APHY